MQLKHVCLQWFHHRHVLTFSTHFVSKVFSSCGLLHLLFVQRIIYSFLIQALKFNVQSELFSTWVINLGLFYVNLSDIQCFKIEYNLKHIYSPQTVWLQIGSSMLLNFIAFTKWIIGTLFFGYICRIGHLLAATVFTSPGCTSSWSTSSTSWSSRTSCTSFRSYRVRSRTTFTSWPTRYYLLRMLRNKLFPKWCHHAQKVIKYFMFLNYSLPPGPYPTPPLPPSPPSPPWPPEPRSKAVITENSKTIQSFAILYFTCKFVQFKL